MIIDYIEVKDMILFYNTLDYYMKTNLVRYNNIINHITSYNYSDFCILKKGIIKLGYTINIRYNSNKYNIEEEYINGELIERNFISDSNIIINE